jgi:hypothetical protein
MNAPDAIERLRGLVEQGWARLGVHVNELEARAILDHITALTAERDAAVVTVNRQANAVRALHANEETEINRLRKERHEWHHAVSSLDSEREANARLTEEVERLTAESDALAGIVRGWHWLAVGPDEMGDYLHQRELIKASEPYASPALNVLATPAPMPPALPRTS